MPHATGPIAGQYATAFAPVAQQFARHFETGQEVGASLCVYHRGECVVDLWGGVADPVRGTPWTADTLVVVFSVTKGLAAMALNLAAERGYFAWDAPVARYWPAFAQGSKGTITVRQLFNHQAGLAALGVPLTLAQFCDPAQRAALRAVLETQVPTTPAPAPQAYHALTFGMYADHFFEIVVGEPIADFLQREWLGPLQADVFLGTPPAQDARVATLLPVSNLSRLGHMLWALLRGGSTEANVARAFFSGGVAKGALTNPSSPGGMADYNLPPARRVCLPWASATASARGLARAYLPWSVGGELQGRRYVAADTIAQVSARQGWSTQDLVLGKALGWAQGFVKDEVFSPNPESFGHPGIGGPLGWCDPKAQLAIGYTLNRSDWRVRSPRALALCAAIYRCI